MLYSERQAEVRKAGIDVFQYDHIPTELRVQLCYVWKKIIGNEHKASDNTAVADVYKYLVNTIAEGQSLERLANTPGYVRRDFCAEFYAGFMQEQNAERVLDYIECTTHVIDTYVRMQKWSPGHSIDAAMSLINDRMRQHGVGYKYVSGTIVRADSELLHSEVVLPALTLLRETYL